MTVSLQPNGKNETIPTDMSALSSQPYKGTRDYYPEDKKRQNYIFSVWRNAVQRFGYEEYGAPTIEPLEVYAAKSGQELANEQTYTFTDRGGRVVAIRPEMTPSVSRMVAARRQELAYPARFFSIANFMRYERPQRGREREFWQLNVDIFGVDTMRADIEILTIADTIMKDFGAKLDDYKIRINNRQLINFVMAGYFGLDEVQGQAMVKLLDRKDKITDQDFVDQATLIFDAASTNLFEELNKLKALIAATTIDELPEEILATQAATDLKQLFDALAKAGVETAVFDMTLMRGLDYYTGTVFEVFDTHPDNNRSLFGGGRYDGLVGLFGAEPISAVGMAPGGTMMENFLEVRGLLPDFTSSAAAYIVVIDGQNDAADSLAKFLREKDINVEVDITERKLDKQLKTAVKKAVPFMIFVGKNEVETGEFTLKNTVTGDEQKLNFEDLVDALR